MNPVRKSSKNYSSSLKLDRENIRDIFLEKDKSVKISNGVKLILGLGNPGRKYDNSRHNLGYRVVNALAEELDCSFKKKLRSKSLIATYKDSYSTLMLALPLTFMNLSGQAVRVIKKEKNINYNNLFVICDDINLDFGVIRIKPSGSDGGHNGLHSVIDELGTNQFPRLRVGIRGKRQISDLSKYVLSDFTSLEKKKLKKVISQATECVKLWIDDRIDVAMNRFNRKRQLDN